MHLTAMKPVNCEHCRNQVFIMNQLKLLKKEIIHKNKRI